MVSECLAFLIVRAYVVISDVYVYDKMIGWEGDILPGLLCTNLVLKENDQSEGFSYLIYQWKNEEEKDLTTHYPPNPPPPPPTHKTCTSLNIS